MSSETSIYNRRTKFHWFTQKQNSIIISASFALFTLAIIHFKRWQMKPRVDDFEGAVDGVVVTPRGRGIAELLPGRVFTTSWSLDLGWGGVVLSVMTSILWILLSKIMRFNPISSMINYWSVICKDEVRKMLLRLLICWGRCKESICDVDYCLLLRVTIF